MKKKIHVFFWWLFWILFLEIVYRIFIFNTFFDKYTISVIIFSLPWVFIIWAITTLLPEKINKFLTIFFTCALTIITLAQIVYYNFYTSIFSFFSLTTGAGQVMEFWQAILNVMLSIWYVFLIVLIPLILFLIFKNKLFNFKRLSWKINLVNLVLFILSLGGAYLTTYKFDSGIYSINRLLFSTHAPLLTANKVGLNTTQALDLYRYIFGFNEEIFIEETSEEILEEPGIEYNAIEIDFDKLINKTSNKTIKNMHKYFKNVSPTQKNKYTGLFKDKNLIFITAEAFDTIALDEKITPTLYKMANNSYVFTNYYQPLFPVSTSDGEYMNLTSLIPKEGVWSFYRTSKISMPLGFGTMFKKAGYTSYGFHNHTYSYYDRDDSHPNIGLTYYGCGNGLEKKMNCSHWPNSDKEMIESTLSYYLEKDKPFASYYMTVSGHLNYNFYGNNMASRNKSKVKNLKYSEAVKAYYATQIELDKAMEILLKELDEANKLDDTLIVLAPDHYPYGLTTEEMNEVSKTNRSNKFENYHTTLIMYNPAIEKTEIDKIVSSIDILPTIYNLYGLEYDSRLLMGTDIFSESEGLVIFSDRSWITKYGKYNSVIKKFTKTTKEELPENYIDKINTKVYQKFSMSSLILENNYYSKLGLK
ncbi:MAG: sulfatase-like hydrolase/transferase [Bacilli bacterium]|nr:sulfatase-like hydrolase/transferase [Bacilli bacterium]